MFDVPVALIVFNRPCFAIRALKTLRLIKPRRLFVIADGPREGVKGDLMKVQETRAAIEAVDWDCELVRIYSDHNLGCNRRIRTGISEVFQHVDELVVLEDDCVPEVSFFDFTKTLLERYRADGRVMAISGNCFLNPVPDTAPGQNHYFSKFMHCWGWATWKRAWNLYDESDDLWLKLKKTKHFPEWIDGIAESEYWENEFAKFASGQIDSWCIPWQISCWMNQGLTALPTVNLVSNVGFSDSATHTKNAHPVLSNLPTFPMSGMLSPVLVSRNARADREADKLIFSGRYHAPTGFKAFSRMMRRHCLSLFRRAAA